MFNRNLVLILLTNIVLGAPMPMLIILGGLAGARLAPLPVLITLPVSVQLLSGILFATPLSIHMGRKGRRAGFLLVAVLTVVGGVTAAMAMVGSSFWLLCLAHLVMGAALVGVNFLRFAAAESVSEDHRPNAISFTLASGLVAALLGPSLFAHTQDLLAPVPFAGAYIAIALLGVLGAIPVLMMLLPPANASSGNAGAGGDVRGVPGAPFTNVWQLICARRDIRLAIGVAAVAQGIMVLMMVPTPQAMVVTGFDHAHAADVIRWHVVAMFAPGLITGILIQRFGVRAVILVGLMLLLIAAAVAVAGTTSLHFHGALILLGVGWNFGFVGGTQLLQRSVSDQEKAQVQGINDTLVAIASVSASVLSGVLYAGIGWLATSSVMVVLMVLAVAWFIAMSRRQVVALL
jgi:predicted MFS family arabinose efflux permease